ncbi:MAG: hypothetical protein JWQ71_1085 [Pedosphaera sp.]|nr:hypothetical protein [Pedosphaera sp.]
MENQLNAPRKSSKLKVFLVWALVVGNIIFWTVFSLWYFRPEHSEKSEDMSVMGHVLVMTFLGGFFLMAGVAGYLLVIFTTGLTFDFSRPAWEDLKKKIYVANIIVPIIFLLGVGFIVSAFLTPVLNAFGVTGTAGFMLPVMGTFCLSQIVFIWVLIWSPVEKRFIDKRLTALGVTREQLQTGWYIGLSNPDRGTLKRWFAIEEDMGMLWFSPGQMIYWGDNEQFGIGKEQLVKVERKVDAKSTTMLSGTAHVILHAKLPDGSARQIRLHTEGIKTMGGKRKAMDALSDRINAWLSEGNPNAGATEAVKSGIVIS